VLHFFRSRHPVEFAAYQNGSETVPTDETQSQANESNVEDSVSKFSLTTNDPQSSAKASNDKPSLVDASVQTDNPIIEAKITNVISSIATSLQETNEQQSHATDNHQYKAVSAKEDLSHSFDMLAVLDSDDRDISSDIQEIFDDNEPKIMSESET